MAHWGYAANRQGPEQWKNKYPDALGKKQSPINIITTKTRYQVLPRLLVKYPTEKFMNKIQNNGHTYMCTGDCRGTELSGGPLKYRYELAQFHGHWGPARGTGSEHTVDGDMYDSEIHLVHWNKDMFSSAAEALTKNNGLAVIGIFVKTGKHNEAFDVITKHLDLIKFKDQKINVKGGFNPSVLLPENPKYWTYDGSLTTPPCSESVTWIVMKDPIELSSAQLDTMREMSACEEGLGLCEKLDMNYRPVCPTNDRTVVSNFTQ